VSELIGKKIVKLRFMITKNNQQSKTKIWKHIINSRTVNVYLLLASIQGVSESLIKH